MIYIAHRANYKGVSNRENHPDQIIEADKAGFAVEVDVHYDGKKWAFGHDKPEYEAKETWLRGNFGNYNIRMFCHAKNLAALQRLSELNNSNYYRKTLQYFWHETDSYTVLNNGLVWSFPGKLVPKNGIMVKPDISILATNPNKPDIYGVCSDDILFWRNQWSI